MVARRRKQRVFANEDEAAAAALAVVPVTDEDPAIFWGPDWQEQIQRAEAERAGNRREVYYSLDEFFESLEDGAE